MDTPIVVPTRATQHIAALIAQHQMSEAALKSAVTILSATLDVPDGWQLQAMQNGSMSFVSPEQTQAMQAQPEQTADAR